MAEKLPAIYLFNPTCEMAIANGTVAWQPNRKLQKFEHDLDVLPTYLAESNDIVIVHRIPSPSFIKQLNRSGISSSQFASWEQLFLDEELKNRQKGWIKPWGWSQVVHHRFRTLKATFSPAFLSSSVGEWCAELKLLFSRIIARDILAALLESGIRGLVNENAIPLVCTSTEQIELNHKQYEKSILKAPWSSSGRGLQKVNFPGINMSILNWSRGVIKSQGYLMYEPLFTKVMDFAFQFEIKNDSIEYLGTSWFYTDEKGAYKGNYLTMPIDLIPKDFFDLFKTNEMVIVEILLKQLQNKFIGKYIGFAGVDAMFVIQDNEAVIHPCVEINLRTNMGNIAMRLQHLTKQGFSKFEIGMVSELKNVEGDTLHLSEVTENSLFCAYLKE